MSKRRRLFGSKKIRPVVPPLQKEDEEPKPTSSSQDWARWIQLLQQFRNQEIQD
jgi:hypothetical protein